MAKSRSFHSQLKKKTRPAAELSVEQLRWRCDSSFLGIETTNDVKPIGEIIGQPRALKALRLGLGMRHLGYNIFVAGPSGTGRTTTIKRLLAEFSAQTASLEDKLYVHNFKNPDMPMLLCLPAGQGAAFRDDMKHLVATLMKVIPATLDSSTYQERRKAIIEKFQEEQKVIIRALEEEVKARGFAVIQLQVGTVMKPEVVPIREGKPVSFDVLEELAEKGEITKNQFDELKSIQDMLETKLEETLKLVRTNERTLRQTLADLDNLIVLPVVRERIDELKKKYADPKVHAYLDDVQSDIMGRLREFASEDQQSSEQPVETVETPAEKFLEYQVNLIIDHSATKGTPVVIETNPKFKNLFGIIERTMDKSGVVKTDFMHIKAGSLLQADGGFLVLNALDTLIEPGVWHELKRTLRNNLLEIHTAESVYPLSVTAIKPEAIPINVKVIMIGDPFLYDLLYFEDEDFKKIFKIRADFDIEMPKDSTAITNYISFIKMICDEENLHPFDKTAIAEVIEFGVRLAGRQNKLSTRFNIIADLLRESNYWADQEKCSVVSREHVKKAITERNDRMKMIEDKIQEMILENLILIDTEGAVIGQVNGLSVYELGEYAFARPSRITARTGLGRSGVINIERESALSGKTHDKGVLILSGYLRAKYAQDKPLVMSASICFEQSYTGVEGDSASSAEIYAILSSIADVPIRQDLAVTGSINQKGEIQPIGGVNLKIEGFFDVCKARGLTGTQGVLIPYENIKDLMLREDVIEAIRDGKFHIYPVRTVDEGIEILTGVKAGKRLPSGKFEPGTINDLVDHKLREYARRYKEIGEGT